MEPLNLMVSLSHFGNSAPTIPPKEPRRARKSRNVSGRHEAQSVNAVRRALHRLRAAFAQ
jgi:hypothetical protein